MAGPGAWSILILSLGAVLGEPFFKANHEYEYEYEAKIMSGIPKLASHYAGLTIKGNMIVQASDRNKYKIAMKNISFVNFNEPLEGPDPANWRTMQTPEPRPVESKVQTILDDAIEYTMVNGIIRDIKVSENEPEWSLNCLKALASLVKVQVPAANPDLSKNLIRPQSQLPHTWKALEEGLDGVCENTYHVSELPEYMVIELDPGLAEKCQGKKVFQIEKSRDINKCSQRTAFEINQPGRLVCPNGNCESVWQRSSLTTYLGCGESAESMELYSVLNEGEIQQSLLGYNVEYVLTGSRQTMKLKTIRTESEFSHIREFASPRSINDLLYEYPKVVMKMREMNHDQKSLNDTQENYIKQRQKRSASENENPVLYQVSSNSLFTNILKKLVDVVIYLKDGGVNFGEKMTSSHVLTLTKLLSLLKVGQLNDLYGHVKEIPVQEQDKEDVRQLFLEAVVASGTDESIKFITNLIQEGEISPAQSGIYVAFLPHYIQTPTVQVLEDVFNLIRSQAIKQNRLLKTNAELSFAVLLNRACVDRSRVERFPVNVFGDFCNTRSSNLATKYIPYFANLLHSTSSGGQKGSLLQTIGIIGHESIIPILLPYVEGKSGSSLSLQRLAIYSLENAAKAHREKLLPVMSSLVHNPSGDRSVRIAALSMLLTMKPDLVHFQRLATSLWHEEDVEFHKFVYSTLKSLSQIEQTSEPSQYTTLNQNSEKAKVVLDLAKPISGVISSAMNHFVTEWLKELEVGYEFQGAYVLAGKIKTAYAKLEYSLQQLKFTPVEFSFHSMGAATLADRIKQILNLEHEEMNVHPELSKIMSILRKDVDQKSPINIGFWARIFSDIQMDLSLTDDNVDPLLQTLKEYVKNPRYLKQKVCGNTPINFVKVNNWSPSEVLIPSEVGLPILMEVHMPTVVYTEGDFNLDCSKSLPSVTLNVSQKVSSSLNGYIGTISPFTREVISTGIDQQWSFDLPLEVSAEMKMGKLVLTSSTSAQDTSSNPKQLVSYSIRPFSSIKPLEVIDANPPMAHKNTKIIKSQGDLKTETYPFGRNIGLDLLYEAKSESDIKDFRSVIDQLSLYKFSPLNVFLYSFTSTAITKNGQPSCRFNELRLKYDPRKSNTKRVQLDFSMALASKHKHDTSTFENLQDHSIQQKLQQVIHRADVDSGSGFRCRLGVNFEGTSSKAYTFFFTALKGEKNLQETWNLHFENEDIFNLCLDGDAMLPTWTAWDLQGIHTRDARISFNNRVGFGRTCQDHQIEMFGSGYVSPDRRNEIHVSKDMYQCEKAIREVHRMKRNLERKDKTMPDYLSLEKQLLNQVEVKYDMCSRLVKEYQTLDKLKFRVTFRNIPQYVQSYGRLTETLVKSYLMPFVNSLETIPVQDEIDVELDFIKHSNTANIKLAVGGSALRYANIRLPDRLTYILPMKVTETVVDQFLDNLVGQDLYSVCNIGDSTVRTFDKKIYKFDLDDCYHVLTAHTGQMRPLAVLGRKVDGKLDVLMYMLGTEIFLSSNGPENKVTVDNQTIRVERGEDQDVIAATSNISVSIQRSADDVLSVKTPYLKLIYARDWLEVRDHTLVRHGRVQGLCGDNDGDRRADVQSADSCVTSSYEKAALSFQLPYTCQTPRPAVLQAAGSCHQVSIEHPAVTKLNRVDLRKCAQRRHSVARQGNKLCYSTVPVMECTKGCVPRAEQWRNVSFACLPAAVAKVLQQEAVDLRNGKVIPKLRHMHKTYVTEMLLPTSCGHPALGSFN